MIFMRIKWPNFSCCQISGEGEFIISEGEFLPPAICLEYSLKITSLCAVVTICATLVNSQRDTETAFDQLI